MHHRHSIRLEGYDYSQNGAYFVTLCTWQRKELFGKIVAGEMQLNNWGKIVEEAWLHTNHAFPNTIMDLFVIMPNHFHCVILIDSRNNLCQAIERVIGNDHRTVQIQSQQTNPCRVWPNFGYPRTDLAAELL